MAEQSQPDPSEYQEDVSIFSHWTEDLIREEREAAEAYHTPLIGSQIREDFEREEKEALEQYHLSGGLIGHHLLSED